jgi:hypothetical protein
VSKGLGAASLVLGALLLAGCNGQAKTTCYGVEPDGEVEKLRPCPSGWPDGSKRKIGEDEYKELEVVDLKKTKKKGL